MSPRIEGVAWAVTVVLLGAAVYEALVAIEVVPVGREPGAGATLEGVAMVAAVLASVVGAVVSVAHAFEPVEDPRPVWIVLAPAGFLFLLARWLSFDPYYLPSLRRYSEGEIHGSWIAVLGALSVVAGMLALRFPRAGSVAVSAVLVVGALTAWVLPIGK